MLEESRPQIVTGDELSSWLGIARRTLSEHAGEGRVVKADGGFDLKASVRTYCLHLRGTAAGRGGKEHVESLTAQRSRLSAAQADLAEAKLAVQRGQLLDAAEVERVWGDHIRKARSAILAVPSRIRQLLGHIGDMETRVIDRELRSALAALGEAPAPEADAA